MRLDGIGRSEPLRPAPLLGLAIHTYSALIEAVRHLVLPLLRPLPGYASWDIEQRTAANPASSPDAGPTVWIHAASMGEAKVLVKFLSILVRHNPDERYLLTATTRAGLELLKTLSSPRVAGIRLLPLDTVPLMTGIVGAYALSRVWLMETELWPALLWVCARRGIPVGIVNARMEERSFRGYRALRSALRPLTQNLHPVLAQTSDYARRFTELGVNPEEVHVTGNLKSVVDIAPTDPHRRAQLRAALGISPPELVLTAGCVHPTEGIILRRFHEILTAEGAKIRLIVVPRHLKAARQIAEELGNDTLRLADVTASSTEWQRCMIEKMGILEPMYSLADAAFVGGTFVPVGGHNVWDAAQYAIPVFFGPVHHTQRLGCETLERAGVGVCVNGAGELSRAVKTVLGSQSADFGTALERLRDEMRSRRQLLEQFLP